MIRPFFIIFRSVGIPQSTKVTLQTPLKSDFLLKLNIEYLYKAESNLNENKNCQIKSDNRKISLFINNI